MTGAETPNFHQQPHKSQKHTPKTPMNSQVSKPIAERPTTKPTFWQTSEGTTSLQVHTAKDANLLKKELEARRIAYSVVGERLEVFEIRRTVAWVSRWATEHLPLAHRVWGGQADEDDIKKARQTV